jgi:hypothetical protein
MDFRLRCNRTMCVVGPSHSGKSTFVMQLLDNRQKLFDCATNRVIWCYGIKQPQFHDQLQKKGYLLYSRIVSEGEIQPYDIVVLDDLIHESKNSAEVTGMFTRAAHHKPCFIIFIMQNLFPPGKEARTRALNTHYMCLFKNPRDKLQIEIFARQIAPRNSKAILQIFEAATEKAHSYLFIDFTQDCPEELRFRSNLFGKPIQIYKPLTTT